MDQRLIAGLGNIYACEILNAAGIDPWRAAGSLDVAAWADLWFYSNPIYIEVKGGTRVAGVN